VFGVCAPKIELGSLLKLSMKEKENQMYQQEIQSMMYACGDVRLPEKDSSMYLEQVVHVQMKILLEKSHETSKMRGVKFICIEDIVFSLRNSPCKVKKLSNYITFKDIRNKMNKEVLNIKPADSKLKYSWLQTDIYNREDELKDRLYMVDRATEIMTKNEYLDFTECRQASFTFRKGKKFREFINTEYKIKDEVTDVLGFVACEMVFDIVSMASAIRARKQKKKKVSENIHGLFKYQDRKMPILISDIDEACRRLKELKVIF